MPCDVVLSFHSCALHFVRFSSHLVAHRFIGMRQGRTSRVTVRVSISSVCSISLALGVVRLVRRWLFPFPPFSPLASILCTSSALSVHFFPQDKDGSGKIDATELRNIMMSLGENLSDEEVNQMIKEADLNGDGEIDFDEFMRMLS